MDSGTVDRSLNDGGVSSVQFILASALALVFFLALANLVVVQYGRGAIRSALEQGARAGAMAGSPGECEATALHVIGQLLGGRMSDGLAIRCSVRGDQMIAVGSTVFETWTPLAPDISADLTAVAVIEIGS
jgi:hypothetical protein